MRILSGFYGGFDRDFIVFFLGDGLINPVDHRYLLLS